jgi:hypothetical protein
MTGRSISQAAPTNIARVDPLCICEAALLLRSFEMIAITTQVNTAMSNAAYENLKALLTSEFPIGTKYPTVEKTGRCGV